MNNELLTPGDAAKMMGVHTMTVWRWTEEGRIPFVKTIGGHRRYYRSEIEKLLNGARIPNNNNEGTPDTNNSGAMPNPDEARKEPIVSRSEERRLSNGA